MATNPLSPVQLLEKAGLRPYLEGDAQLQIKVMGLLKLPPERQARVRAFIAEHREEVTEILRPYHEGRGLRTDGGSWKARR